MVMLKKILACILVATAGFAWDGFDWEKGDYVEIEKNILVRSGKDKEIYIINRLISPDANNDGGYKDVEVLSIRKKYNGKVELEVYDYEDGKERTLEMDSYQDRKDKKDNNDKYFNNFSSDGFLNNSMEYDKNDLYDNTFFK